MEKLILKLAMYSNGPNHLVNFANHSRNLNLKDNNGPNHLVNFNSHSNLNLKDLQLCPNVSKTWTTWVV